MTSFKTSSQKEIDIWIQDQTTPPFHRFFMTEEKDDITLTVVPSKDDTTISVSSGHGFSIGDTCLILYGNIFQQSEVINVSGDDITLESPICCSLPIIGTQIIRGSIEMNIDGSVTPVTFYCRPGNNALPIDIQHLHVFIRDGSDGDQSTYGGLSALTNGSFVRFTNGIAQNLGNYKTNSDFVQFGATAVYNDKAPSGEYSQDFSFDLKNKYGIVIRLNSLENGRLSFTIQDDLTGLLQHRVIATGQITLNE